MYKVPDDAPKVDYSKMKLTEEQIEIIKQKWKAEDLQNQIKKAKEIHWKIFEVEYWKSTKSLNLLFELNKQHRIPSQKHFTGFVVEISEFKCLKGKTEEEIEKVSVLGDSAIQWEDLDIHIGLNDLLLSIQLRENWLNSLK